MPSLYPGCGKCSQVRLIEIGLILGAHCARLKWCNLHPHTLPRSRLKIFKSRTRSIYTKGSRWRADRGAIMFCDIKTRLTVSNWSLLIILYYWSMRQSGFIWSGDLKELWLTDFPTRSYKMVAGGWFYGPGWWALFGFIFICCFGLIMDKFMGP